MAHKILINRMLRRQYCCCWTAHSGGLGF